MPVLGPVFGGSGDLLEIPTIALLGALGGLFWSLPFALSTWLQNKKTGEPYVGEFLRDTSIDTDVNHYIYRADSF